MPNVSYFLYSFILVDPDSNKVYKGNMKSAYE